MNCSNCGMQLNDGAKFCPGCGTPVAAQPVAAQPAVNNIEDNSTVLLGAVPPAPAADNDQTVFAAAPSVNSEQTVFAASIEQPVQQFQQPAQQFQQPAQQFQQPVQQFQQPAQQYQQPAQQFQQPAQQFQQPAQQYQQPAQQFQQPQYAAPEYPSGQYNQAVAKKKSPALAIIITLVVVIVLAAGAVAALYFTGIIGGGNDPDKLLETADSLYSDKKYDDAIAKYEKVLEKDPLSVDAYLGLSKAYEAQEDNDNAIKVLEDALDELEDEKDIKKINKALDKLRDSSSDDKDDKDDEDEEGTTSDSSNISTSDTSSATSSEVTAPLFDINYAVGDWGYSSGSNVVNVSISRDNVSIDENGQVYSYYSSEWTLTENGLKIDSYYDSIEFVYDAYYDEMSMVMNGNQYYLTRGVAVRQEGKVLNIWCWNNEFQQRVTEFYPGYIDNGNGTGRIGDVTVKWTINPNNNNGYQIPLDAALRDQDYVSADEKIDIFLIEADYADKYVNSNYCLPVSAVGITDADTAQMYPYTKEIATDDNGNLMAVSWQACPGLFAYRRSIAKDVIGTDDPAVVQKYVDNWDEFDKTARKMKERGYSMLSGYDDAYRVFSNNMSQPWVNSRNEIVVDDNLLRWVEQTKTYTDKRYNNGNGLWSEGWAYDQSYNGNVFGFFYSTWGIDFTLMGNAGERGFGDWAVCYGPQSFFWGGTWICAGYQTDNPTLVHDIMYNLTCNADIMKDITLTVQDYTNNMKAMDEIANSSFKSDFLGGQNHIALFTENAKKIDMSNISPYDQGLNETFQAAFRDYFDGTADFDTALRNFYNNAIVMYPALSKP
ncbi:MAG: tetratricopeptide repeat protein [Oscillospiraceae bacterium]